MTITDCPHGMPTPKACFECMEDGAVDPPAPVRPETYEGPAIDSRFDGHCGACNLSIVAGQPIRPTSRKRWVHAGCLP